MSASESMMIPEETSFHHHEGGGGGGRGGILLADDDDYENENEDENECDDEDDEEEYNPPDDNDNDGENFNPNVLSKKKGNTSGGGMTTTKKIKDRRSLMKKQGSSRRRRRSSARFLKIGSANDDDDDDDSSSGNAGGATGNSNSNTTASSLDNLSEVYRNAIRMNAENRINATNSWNINLIDHLDRFVEPELRTGSNSGGSGLNASKRGFNTSNRNVLNNNITNNSNGMDSTMDSTMTGGQSNSTGVNFTKASCTLDASVKIYSYRVDDVHLTSYKVLANLNRTETTGSSNSKKKTNGESADGNDNGDNTEDGGDGGSNTNGGRSSNKSRSNTSSANTLEHNTSNINIHKLDAAFDIDPLFHKMSKNFDEGGAKGLLLANLSVGYGGCKIIFDSTLDDDDDDDDQDENENENEPPKNNNDNSGLEDIPEDVLPQEVPAAAAVSSDNTTVVDVTSLVTKLESLLISSSSSSGIDKGINNNTTSDNNNNNNNTNNTIGSMSLVPQLASLRDQFADLKNDGFVDEIGVSSKRYASSNEEEAEADKSIHLEAIERSRASLADLGRSLNARDASYASDDDYDGGGDGGGCGFDFGGGGDDDDDFGDLHDGDHRFSSSSFQAGRTSFSSLGGNNNGTNGSNGTPNKAGGANNTRPPSFLQSQPAAFSQATVLLDAIASGNISTMESTNHYEYFNSQALANLSSGNLWAGAEHWKKIGRRKTNGGTGTGTGSNSQDDTVTGGKTPANNKKGRKGKTKALSSISSGRVAVLLNKPIDNLDELLLKKPSAPKKKGRSKADPLQLTKAMKTKYGKNDNLLPMDAGIDVKEFTTLFGRPKTNLMDLAKAKRDAALLAGTGTNTRSTKVVGFAGVETWGEHGGDNDSYGDNDDGAGFNFGGGDDDNDYGNNDNPNEFVVPELDDVRKVNKIKIGYAKIAKKVDVKRLKRDLWIELEHTFANNAINNNNNEEEEAKNQDDDDALSTASTVSDPDPVLAGTSDGDENENNTDEDAAAKTTATATTATTLSFQDTVRDMQMNESQPDVTLPFYFICILHLCNEKGLALESSGLDDFIIHSS